jgi:hypothetical protein
LQLEVNIPNPLLTAIIKIYEKNIMKMKLNATLTQPIKISKGFRKRFPLSPTLFDIYKNHIIIKWKEEMKKESNFEEIRTSRLFFSFTDNHVIVANVEDAEQIFIHNLETVITKNDQTFQNVKGEQ